ncbi:hypothetical protein H8D04_00280 [bacterium]|nr:hypothetical protein [bacterium]
MRNKKYIEENEKKYGKRIKQLKHIINDLEYLPTGNSYHEFIVDMYLALVHGRKITPKMESSITKIVKVYTKWLNKTKDPKFLENKNILLNKITMVRNMLEQAPYTSNFKYEKEMFIDSLYSQASNRGSLSPKQKLALNKMYKQYKKKVENN